LAHPARFALAEIVNIHSPGLRFEPKLALTDGTDRFTLIGRFIKQLRDFLAPGGTCLLEIDPKARPTVSRAVTRYFPGVLLVFSKDLAGRWRYAEITVPK
jgi:methylase of polypeptide subunit release factors